MKILKQLATEMALGIVVFTTFFGGIYLYTHTHCSQIFRTCVFGW